ncbi:hypothetical protein [Pectinatus frisingensis]|uniref:hypothetical protein n=1 Tax=Pectinatus frisingensis TaxID=865 RepID=UPI0018C549A7|nr:hypothetical protein [Pectinatus frisingensis]
MKKKGIFIWRDSKDWLMVVHNLLSDIMNDAVVAKVRQNVPEYISHDNFLWLDLIIDAHYNCFYDIKEVINSRFCQYYSHIKAYHGCRPEDVNSYYKNGIVTLDPQMFNQLAYQIFCSKELNFDKRTVEDAIKKVGTNLREGRVFLSLDDQLLVEECGHYLLYGSEYLIAIAAVLSEPSGIDYRQVLRQKGKPTVFLCDVPINFIKRNTLCELTGVILQSWLKYVLYNEIPSRQIDFTLTLYNNVPPDNIVGHYHPDRARDPFYYY